MSADVYRLKISFRETSAHCSANDVENLSLMESIPEIAKVTTTTALISALVQLIKLDGRAILVGFYIGSYSSVSVCLYMYFSSKGLVKRTKTIVLRIVLIT